VINRYHFEVDFDDDVSDYIAKPVIVNKAGSKGYKNTGEYVKYSDIKHILERSDNSDYAVQPTASPKLPSLEDVNEYINTDGNGLVPSDWIERVYNIIKKLGNFA
jgi:hypothetical protein